MFFDKHRFSEMFHLKQFAFIFILATCLFVNNINVYAASSTMEIILNYNTTVAWIYSEYYEKWYLVGAGGYLYFNGNYVGGVDINQQNYITFYAYYDIEGNPPFNTGNIIYNNYYYGRSGLDIGSHQTPIVLKGTFLGDSMTWDEYEESQNVPWYKSLWQKFTDELDRENTALQDAIENVGKMISNWWKKITGDLPEHDGIHGKFGVVDIATPTPLPTPTPKPTPIPFSTVIKNDGQGNSTIIYQYNNPEGTPTESPVNPNINYNYNNSININGGDRNNPIYVQDVGNPEFTSIIDLSDNTISVNIGNLDDSIDAFTDPLSSNVEDVSKISDVFSVFPDDLMITIGCIACISLIAGIIGRFLK